MSRIGSAVGPIGAGGIDDAAAPSQAASEAPASQDVTSTRGSTASAAAQAIGGALLQHSLEAAVGGSKSRAALLASGRDLLHAAAVLSAERRHDPAARDRFLAGARYPQRALLDDVRSVARRHDLHLGARGSTGFTSKHGLVRAQAEGGARADADGLHASGAAEADLAGLEARAAGEAHLGKDGLRASGRAAADVGNVHAEAEGGAHLGRRGLDASGRAQADIGRVHTAAEGAAHLDRRGVQAKGKASLDAGALHAETDGQALLDRHGLRTSGQASARIGVAGGAATSFEGAMGSANASFRAAAEAYAATSGTATIDKTGLRARAHAEVGARIQVAVDADFRTAGVRIGGERLDVNGQIHGEAEVSAYAKADADVAATIKPPRVVVVAEGKAFAGAKASAHGSIGLGDFIKISGDAEAWAGAGAEAGIQAGYDDGKLKLGFHLGAAVGVGAGLSFGVEIDVKKIATAIGKGLTGGLLDLTVLLDRGDGTPPIQVALVEVLFPPEVVGSAAAAGALQADLRKDSVRFEERKRERDEAERHIRAAVKELRGASRP